MDRLCEIGAMWNVYLIYGMDDDKVLEPVDFVLCFETGEKIRSWVATQRFEKWRICQSKSETKSAGISMKSFKFIAIFRGCVNTFVISVFAELMKKFRILGNWKFWIIKKLSGEGK